MKKILTTTTSNLEGWIIKDYLQPVSSNIVVGANILSDISASITDFFGGRSGTYERKLQQIYDQSILNLQGKATSLGATAIVGLKIDIDEISGKNSQMFMITAYGTPVKAIRIESRKDNEGVNDSSIAIDGHYIENKVKAKRIIEGYQKTKVLQHADIDFILENPYQEFIDTVLAYAAVTASKDASADWVALTKKLGTYFALIDPDLSISTLYNELSKPELNTSYLTYILDFIKYGRLIDLGEISKLLDSEHQAVKKIGLDLLSYRKDYYTDGDKHTLTEIQGKINDNFKPIGIVSSKKGFLSGEKNIWTCSCGRENGEQEAYCGSCSNDIYGFKEIEAKPGPVSRLIEDRLDFL